MKTSRERDNKDKATKLGMGKVGNRKLLLCGCVIMHVLFELFNQQMVGHTQADTHTIRTWAERSHTQQDREQYQDILLRVLAHSNAQHCSIELYCLINLRYESQLTPD